MGHTPGVRDILAATDFSDNGDAAVRTAHAYARALGARLHVLHVTWAGELGVTDLFAELKARLGDAVPVTIASQRGDPADEIVRYARRHGVQLVVVGTHGRSGVSRAVLGSVAARVVRGAPCPVLTVPVGAAPAAEETPAAPREERAGQI